MRNIRKIELFVKCKFQGPLSIAVPGEVAGYWEAKRRYGSPDISWERLLRPTIAMLREGVTVDATLAKALSSKDDLTDLGMRSVFLNPETGEVWGEGEAYIGPSSRAEGAARGEIERGIECRVFSLLCRELLPDGLLGRPAGRVADASRACRGY